MPRMFGTDGVRGLANRALTAQLALDLGDAAVRVLGDDGDKANSTVVAVHWSAAILAFPAIFLQRHCPQACPQAVSM